MGYPPFSDKPRFDCGYPTMSHYIPSLDIIIAIIILIVATRVGSLLPNALLLGVPGCGCCAVAGSGQKLLLSCGLVSEKRLYKLVCGGYP